MSVLHLILKTFWQSEPSRNRQVTHSFRHVILRFDTACQSYRNSSYGRARTLDGKEGQSLVIPVRSVLRKGWLDASLDLRCNNKSAHKLYPSSKIVVVDWFASIATYSNSQASNSAFDLRLRFFGFFLFFLLVLLRHVLLEMCGIFCHMHIV